MPLPPRLENASHASPCRSLALHEQPQPLAHVAGRIVFSPGLFHASQRAVHPYLRQIVVVELHMVRVVEMQLVGQGAEHPWKKESMVEMLKLP